MKARNFASVMCVLLLGGMIGSLLQKCDAVRDTWAQTVTTSANLKDVVVSWDPPTTNADGTPLTDLAGYEVALSSGDLPGAEILASKKTTETSLRLDFAPTIGNIDLKVWARALDFAGNASEWSDPVELTNDTTPPAKVVIKITIEVQHE